MKCDDPSDVVCRIVKMVTRQRAKISGVKGDVEVNGGRQPGQLRDAMRAPDFRGNGYQLTGNVLSTR
jgi:hypothetical protein